MANEGKSRLRLILCGICFRADCPLSRWVSDDDSGIGEALDEMREAYFERMHDELDRIVASKLTVEEKRERIEETLREIQEETGQPVEVENLDELLGSDVKGIEQTESEEIKTVTDKGSFIDDILRKFSEHEQAANEQQKQKEQGH